MSLRHRLLSHLSKIQVLSARSRVFASGASSASELNACRDFESIVGKIHLDRLDLFQKFFINHIGKTINIKGRIRILRLIQSHGQRRPRSASLVQENPNGFDLFALKILGNLLSCRLRYFKHLTPSCKKIGPFAGSMHISKLDKLILIIRFVNGIFPQNDNVKNHTGNCQLRYASSFRNKAFSESGFRKRPSH